MTNDKYRCEDGGARGSASGPLRMIYVDGPTANGDMCNRVEVFGRDREEIARILLAAFEPADDDDWEGIADQAIRERDEARRELQQARAEKLQAVKVLVGVDECCDECQDASEGENQRREGGDATLAVDLASVLADPDTKTVKLRTAAETRSGNRYSVYLIDDPGGVVLRISDTPGSWYVRSLLDGGLSPETYIDYGQGWLWVNVHEVFDELRQLASGMGEQ